MRSFRIHPALWFLLLLSLLSALALGACSEEDDKIDADGDRPSDGDVIADGDGTDGDDTPDGDQIPDGDETDGDDAPDGDRPPDGDENPDGDDTSDGDQAPDGDDPDGDADPDANEEDRPLDCDVYRGSHHYGDRQDPLSNCATCHGSDLKGGRGPSCYGCHTNNDHQRNLGGIHHLAGQCCEWCHGPESSGGLGPACDLCHGRRGE